MDLLLKEKDPAPEFSATACDGKHVSLAGLIAGGPVLLSFLRSLG
ncbi:MAG: hypothetical protein ABFD62_07165 [Syntrophaceae bacterium]